MWRPVLKGFFAGAFLVILFVGLWKTASLNDERALYHHELALRALSRGDLSTMENELRMGLGLAVLEKSRFLRSLGHHYFRSHQYPKAAKMYERAILLDRRYEESLLLYLAESYAEVGRNREASAILLKLKTAYPKRYDAEAEELFSLLQSSLNSEASTVFQTVTFRGKIPEDQLNQGPFEIGGDWLNDGTQSSAYGFSYTPLKVDSTGAFTASKRLRAISEMPYLVGVRTHRQKVVLWQKFLLNTKYGLSPVVTLDTQLLSDLNSLRKKTATLLQPSTHQDHLRRVFIFWIDCGSWWFIRSGIERGVLPNAKDLLSRGVFGEMISDPPWTSIAMGRISTFERNVPSLLNLALLQLKGIPFFDSLIHLKSNSDSLSGRFAKEGISFVDLVFNEPYANEAQDQSSEQGFEEEGQTNYQFNPTKTDIPQKSEIWNYLEKKAALDFQKDHDIYGKWLIANLWDDTEKKIHRALNIWKNSRGPRVLLFRIPALDILSHYFFQNDSSISRNIEFLHLYYEYLDDRLGLIRSQMDSDDTLFFISDHGILNHFRHSKSSLFMAEGPSFKQGVALQPFPIQQFPYLVWDLVMNEKPSPNLVERR